MPAPRTESAPEPSVGEQIAHAQLMAALQVGESRGLRFGQLLDEISDDEATGLMNALRNAECRVVAELLGAQLGPVPINGKRVNGTASMRHQDLKCEDFDALVIRTIRSLDTGEGVKRKDIHQRIECSIGKLRLSLARCKEHGRVRQVGDRNGAHYHYVEPET